MLPVSGPVLISELDSAREILAKWVQRASAGIPMIDVVGSEENLDDFVREMCGELLIAAGKCSNLAEVLYGSR